MNGQEKPRGRGCLFWGGIIAAIMLLMIIIGGYVGYRFAKNLATTLINEYTETNSVAVPTVQLSPEEIRQLTNRLDGFQGALRDSRAVEPLILTEEEVNALLTHRGDPNSRGRLYVTLEEDKIKAQLSIPAEEFGFRMLQGRYLNGTGEFLISVREGVLRVNIQELSVKGKPLPEDFMRPIRAENHAVRWTNDADFNAVIAKLEEIRVENGKMVVVPKK